MIISPVVFLLFLFNLVVVAGPATASVEMKSSFADSVFGSPPVPYENRPPLYGGNLENIVGSVYFLKSRTKFKKMDGELAEDESQGLGVALGKNLILTVDHVVSNYELVSYTPFGTVAEPAEKVSEATYMVFEGREQELEALLRNKEADVALFRAPKDLKLKPFLYPIGDSDQLRVGNYIYLIGNPLSMGLNVREGIVSSLRAPKLVESIMVDPKTVFMLSNGLNPGDSGGPVIAVRNGRYELVGLSQGTFVVSQRMGWALKINFVMDMIGPWLK